MFADLPLLTGLHEQGRDQYQKRNFIWKDTYHSCTPANLLINPFQTVGCADRALWCSGGKSKTVNSSVRFSSIRADKRGAERVYFQIAS